MCGICGKLLLKGEGQIDRLLIERMSSVMSHRGPDDSGMYITRKVGLGHRRLSIIDLHTGKQPLSNEDDTVWVVFNGEIYNFHELRDELLKHGHTFKTQTDTEVIVHLYEELGENFVSRLRGMFAIALWDQSSETLILARDRVGIKPLYYFISNECVIFGSEMKSILMDDSIPREMNLNGLRLLFMYYYIPGEETLLKGIKKLLPGHYLKVKNGSYIDKQYWDLSYSPQREAITFKDAEASLVTLLKQTVREHMISDVPVGFLLSGGIDSTALLSYAIEETDKQIRTFTIGFEGESFADERYFARLAAKRFGTEHYDISITANEFRDFLPRYVWHMEEPICEPPAVALYYVSRLAKDYVKVLLSGEGGDEAFAGYQNYRNLVWLDKLKHVTSPFSRSFGQFLASLGQITSVSMLEKYGGIMAMEFDAHYLSRTSNPLTFVNKNPNEFYDAKMLNSGNGIDGIDTYRRSLLDNVEKLPLLNKMLYIDTKTWLPDDLLLKADKITMANSIELRVPLLDHLVLEYAASLPAHFKLNGVTTKYILKKAFKERVPHEILNRKKTGFPVPYDHWLSNELNDYVHNTLLSSRASNRGYFRNDAIVRLLKGNNGRSDYSKTIFLMMVLELWHQCFIDRPAA